jgi:hypothetical protein
VAQSVDLEQTESAPAHIAYVEGEVTVEREGQAETATQSLPLVEGDRLKTAEGRAEILFPDGSVLDLDIFTTLDIQSAVLFRVTGGRVRLTVRGADHPSTAIRYQVDTPAASAATGGPGEYRVAIFSNASGVQAELAVMRGVATLATERGTTIVSAGQRSLAADGSGPTRPELFNSARYDAFDQWADARREERTGRRSAQYLPRELDVYSGTFDRYGQWEQEPDYGYVWYPSVAADWRPYYRGYWSPVRPYGWTWIGLDFWAWPTHHYGRWGYHRSRWFWIPGRHWSPAWVHWGSAPGYVSWCPLGFDNRPVFSLSYAVGRPWDGWVVVPRSHFGGHRYFVPRHAIASHRLDRATPFVLQARAPVAVPRWSRSAAAPAGRGRDDIPGARATLRDAPSRRAVPRNPAALPTDRAAGRAAVPPDSTRSALAVRRAPERNSSDSPPAPPVTQPLPRAFERRPDAAPGPRTSTERWPERRSGVIPQRQAPRAPSAEIVPSAPPRAPESPQMRTGGEVPGDREIRRRMPSAVGRDSSGGEPPRLPPQPQYRERGISPRERARGEGASVRPQAAPESGPQRGRESGAGARRRDGGAERAPSGNGRSSGGARRRSP